MVEISVLCGRHGVETATYFVLPVSSPKDVSSRLPFAVVRKIGQQLAGDLAEGKVGRYEWRRTA